MVLPGGLLARTEIDIASGFELRVHIRRVQLQLGELEVVTTMPQNADVTERLCKKFAAQLPVVVVAEVVAQCRGQLAGSPPSAMPELVERLARQRLLFLDTVPAWMS